MIHVYVSRVINHQKIYESMNHKSSLSWSILSPGTSGGGHFPSLPGSCNDWQLKPSIPPKDSQEFFQDWIVWGVSSRIHKNFQHSKPLKDIVTNSAGSLNSSLLKTKTLRSVEKNLGRLRSKGHASPFGCDTVWQSLYGYLGYTVPKFCWKVGSLIGVNECLCHKLSAK